MASRGRPKKDPNAPTANYNLSKLELARRATQKRIRDQRRKARKASAKAEQHKYNAKKIENSAKKIQAGLNGTASRIIDQSDLGVASESVKDLVEEQEEATLASSCSQTCVGISSIVSKLPRPSQYQYSI